MDGDEREEPAGRSAAEWKTVFLRGAKRGKGKNKATHKFESVTSVAGFLLLLLLLFAATK